MTTSLPFSSQQYSKIFISHANPEDNYFASWLASKLNLMGYEVWCDTQQLKGGEDFWREIELVIRSQAIKLLFVVSKASVTKKGTLKELAVADKVKDRENFIIPLRLEDVPFEDFPSELIRLTAIEFSNNWASGLQQLILNLDTDYAPRKDAFEINQINEWWNSGVGSIRSEPIQRNEQYWSNWFSCTLPDKLYIHQLLNPKVKLPSLPYPVVHQDRWLISFACANCLQRSITVTNTIEVTTEEFRTSKIFSSTENGAVIKDTNNKVIQLLNLAFIYHAVSKGLHIYELSQGTVAYFPPILHNQLSTARIKLNPYGLTYVSLTGETSGYQWHYAIQGRAFLFPEPIIGVSHHIIFTEKGLPIESKDQHRLRRKVGSGWYNKQWRDRLLAALLTLADNSDDIKLNIRVCCSQILAVDVMPRKFTSTMGYLEP